MEDQYHDISSISHWRWRWSAPRLALPGLAAAQTAAIPPSITTPDKVETRIGTLEFKDGAPSKATLEKVYDNLDFTHAFEAFVNTFQGVNAERRSRRAFRHRRARTTRSSSSPS